VHQDCAEAVTRQTSMQLASVLARNPAEALVVCLTRFANVAVSVIKELEKVSRHQSKLSEDRPLCQSTLETAISL
jgi:hypothetical protein